MEIMRFYADKYCLLSSHVQSTALQITLKDSGKEDAEMAAGIIETLIPHLADMKLECEKIGLESSADTISIALGRWQDYHNERTLMVQCAQINNSIVSELKRKVCFILPRESQALYAAPLSGWEEIAAAFPDVADDIEEMSKCRAFGRYSASVFHVLLVVEHGLIALGKSMRISDPKQGWDATCKALEKSLKDGRAVAPPHIKKHFAFYELVNKDIQSMKMAWRNKVSHAANKLVVETSDFKPQVAEKIITACHGFMLLLATEGPQDKARTK